MGDRVAAIGALAGIAVRVLEAEIVDPITPETAKVRRTWLWLPGWPLEGRCSISRALLAELIALAEHAPLDARGPSDYPRNATMICAKKLLTRAG